MATEAEIRRQLAEAQYSQYNTQAPERNPYLGYGESVGGTIGALAGVKGGPAGMALGQGIGSTLGSLIEAPFKADQEEKNRRYMKELQGEQRHRMLAQQKLLDQLAKIEARRQAMQRMQQQAQQSAALLA